MTRYRSAVSPDGVLTSQGRRYFVANTGICRLNGNSFFLSNSGPRGFKSLDDAGMWRRRAEQHPGSKETYLRYWRQSLETSRARRLKAGSPFAFEYPTQFLAAAE